jgi:hypothetical protein
MTISENAIAYGHRQAAVIRQIQADGYPAARAYTNTIYTDRRSQDCVARRLVRSARKFTGPVVKKSSGMLVFAILGTHGIEYDLTIEVDSCLEAAIISESIE